jgi:hypothetical protein
VAVSVNELSRAERIARVEELFPALARIGDPELRTAVTEIWVEAWETSGWLDLSDVPKGVYAGGRDVRPLVEHVRAVTEGVEALALKMHEIHGWELDVELLVTAALLHDTSKVVESTPGPEGSPVLSDAGRLLQHGVWTVQRVLQRDLSLELAHMVVSHTPMSKLLPQTKECLILYYVDMVDSDLLAMEAGLPLLLSK